MSVEQFAALDLTLVTTYGRSGSSRLLELLKLTGARAVAGNFPYEVRSLQFGLLCHLGLGQVHPDGAILYSGFCYPAPVRRRKGEDETEFRRRVVSDEEYLRCYGESRKIAEKAVGLGLASVIGDACPRACFVFIDRDPRDVFLSVLAINARRGYPSFGAEDGTMALAERIAGYYRLAAKFRLERPGRTRIVSYSDLVTNPLDAAAQAVGSLPDVPVAVPGLTEITAPEHVTATTVGSSVGRWRSMADSWPNEFEKLAAAYSDFLRGGAQSPA